MGSVSQQSFISAGQAKTNGVDVLEVATRAYSVASPLQGSRIMIETQPTSDSTPITRTFGCLQEACFINLPVLKTHVVSTMTLAMKNPMGILPRPDRRAMHTLGIDQCIVDMNRAIKPDLTIVDGSVGQDGDGPLYGEKADLQVLVAGRDSLAVDLVCCQLVGVKPRDIPHLKLALEQLGKPSWTLVGEDAGDPGVIKQFRLPEQK